jgi:hypothetical protein
VYFLFDLLNTEIIGYVTDLNVTLACFNGYSDIVSVWISSIVEGHVVSNLSYRHRSEIFIASTSLCESSLNVKSGGTLNNH